MGRVAGLMMSAEEWDALVELARFYLDAHPDPSPSGVAMAFRIREERELARPWVDSSSAR